MITVQNLSKRYGKVEAVRDVSFSVGTDQVLGFLGPNGAGKTTVMKILTGYHFPSGGKALVDGIPVDEDPVEVKRRIGYLPENVPLYGDLTVDEYLGFIADSRLIPLHERREKINACLESCGLTAYRSRKIETLSKGYRQRTGLAQAILHDPPILILDEPTTGLDPNQIIEIRSLIKELGKRKTVILSTHILQEVEAICSQVLILNEGRIAAQGRPEEIAGTMKGGDTWELILKAAGSAYGDSAYGDGAQAANAETLRVRISQLGSDIAVGAAENADGGTVHLNFFVPAGNDVADGEKIFDWAIAGGLKILGMTRKKLSLEDIFVKLTAEEKGISREAEK
ncbi:multidrug ABC transporter ATP-binding protein [Spirochaetia bacterium]|nr:multidrug ABC transporter ATP-binding protein [Spirochaetia bacterium]